ncbi:MAG: carboxypeptidase M32 [Gaiellaceae bacterium]
MAKNKTYEQLETRLAEIADLGQVSSVIGWDQQVMMPEGSGALRANQRATLTRVLYELFTSPEMGRLLDGVRSYEESLDPDSDEASTIRVARRDYEKAVRVPSELRAEISRASSEGLQVWAKAKDASDFATFLPALERAVELRQRYIDCFDDFDERYDVLLDDFEPNMKSAEVRAVFERLKADLVPLIKALGEGDTDDGFLTGHFPIERQQAIAHEVLNLFGLKPDTWRLDHTRHPFVGGPGGDDVRITTHYRESDLDSFFATMHEYGHALYENQIPQHLVRGVLGTGVSLGVHESQSRMWENLVGRGRPFWTFFYPRLQETFPEQFADVEPDRFYAAVNRVHPSLIRIHADEVTYNMHIILRFELEQDMIEGRVELRDLPEEWNRRMHEYLGIDVPDDARGVLQDMHWGGGHIGYFSTYALGNVMSVQIWERVKEDVPDLEEQFERGDFSALRDWLGERLHSLGRKFAPQDTLERITGSRIDPAPYLQYLQTKHGAGQATR